LSQFGITNFCSIFKVKEKKMSACKFTELDPPALPAPQLKRLVLTFKKKSNGQKDDPATCKLANPPAGVTIAVAHLLAEAGEAPTTLTVAQDKKSFQIPSSADAGLWILGVGLDGFNENMDPVDLVEDCGSGLLILTIDDDNFDAAIRELTVVQQ
jgi:hypothetical protein